MTEGQGATAASVPSAGTGAVPDAVTPEAVQPSAGPVPVAAEQAPVVAGNASPAISEGSTPPVPEGPGSPASEGTSSAVAQVPGPADSSPAGPDGPSPAMPDGSSLAGPDGSSRAMPDGSSGAMPDGSSGAVPEGSSPAASGGSSGAVPEGSSPAASGGSSAAVPEGSSPAASGGSSPAVPAEGPGLSDPAGTSPGEPESASPAEPAGTSAAASDETPAAGGPGQAAPDEDADEDEPHARVDVRRLESALLALRHPIVEVPLRLEAPGVPEARAERRKLLSQIDDYLLPRVRQSGAPVLVAVVGSTGAGKSTLLNSLVGRQVSSTGTRRPTTNSPVLACHPGDSRWFAENIFLPTLPRVRQHGLAMPGRDGLLVLAESDGVPEGIAMLDTPDIDSVVQAHREFAHQFLDASDLWLFMTSASRYADAAVWELLQQAKNRDASLAIVLSRVPPASARQLGVHFDAMLEANGFGKVRRFMIPETVVTEGRLPPDVSAPVRKWLEETAARQERRVAVLTKTMSGVLDTFRTRVPALAAHVEAQLRLRSELLAEVNRCYAGSLGDFDEATRDGSLVRGEILARWQDFAGTGDLLKMLQVRRGSRQANRPRKRGMPTRAAALKAAMRASLEALVITLADRAAESAVAAWQQHEAGAALVRDVAAEAAASKFGASELELIAGLDFIPSPKAQEASPPGDGILAKSSPGLATRTARAVSAWQDHVLQLVQAENVTKRSVARVVSFDEESLALVLAISLLGEEAAEAPTAENPGAVPQRLLASLLGAGLLRDLFVNARRDLHDKVGLLFEEEMLRFAQVVNAAGAPEGNAAAQLHQASYALEAAR
jgi:energy-coupling factor transporter ATP-binding protein EcfA2